MNFSELCAEVYTITGRSDRVAETESAVKSATLKAHQSDYYYKDIFETGIRFDTSDYVQSLDYRALLPRWRALKYLRKWDAVNSTPGIELDVILPEQLFDRYKVQKQDICYLAGDYVQLNSSTQEQYYLLGCYLSPDITKTGFTSWIALDHPYAIVFDAAATVFKAIGKDEEAAAYRTMVPEQIGMIKMSNIEGVGF
jgi:hypothetical protein